MTRTRSRPAIAAGSPRSLRATTQERTRKSQSKARAKKARKWIRALASGTAAGNGSEAARKSPVEDRKGLVTDAVDSSTRLGDSESDNDSMGDDCLPEVDFSSVTAKTKVKELVPGTVVWAKSPKWPHWPALLVKVFPKEKKAVINYFDATMQRTRVALRSMAPFFSSSRSQYIEVGKACQDSEEFIFSLDRAEDYLIKQGLGKSTEAAPNASISLESSSRVSATPPMSPDTPCDTSHDQLADSSHEAQPSEPASPISNNGLPSDHSDEELRIGHPVGRASKRRESKEDGDLKEKRQMWKDIETKLLKYIRRGTTKTHLLDIYHGRKTCERQRLYQSMRARDRQKLRFMAGVGPIIDEELESELTDLLRDLYTEHCMESKADLPSTSYITEVWLPEAIIFAIQKTRRVGRRQAEKLFHSEGVQSMLDLGEDMPVIPWQDAAEADGSPLDGLTAADFQT